MPGLQSAASATVERSVQVQRPGRAAVALDADVYDAARRDLADLMRILLAPFDAAG